MKRFTGITGILLLAALIAFPMAASGQDTQTGKQTMMGSQRGKGQRMSRGDITSNLTAEQREQIKELQKKFRDDNAETIKQLMTKRFDLNTVLASDTPDADKAKAIQKEISELNGKLAQERIDLYIELRKINPDARFGRGSGRGMGIMNRDNNV